MSSGLSKRQVALQCGLNIHTVDVLLERNVLSIQAGCSRLRPKLVGLENLVEGEHYIVCLECGAFQGAIMPRHLQACSGITRATYLCRYPDAPVMSVLSATCKAKTVSQRLHQSLTLKARFRTKSGDVTRRQISEASRRLQATGYRERAAQHLRVLNSRPEQKAARSAESKARWDSGEQGSVNKRWRTKHRGEMLALAANARRHIGRKRTKIHKAAKDAMHASGLSGFVTEYEVGYYSIDEARPDLRLAVEIDGCYWHGCLVCGFSGMDNTRSYDRRKTTYLRNRGWTILHLREHEIKDNLNECVRRVGRMVEQLSAREVAA
jgi:DNA mismatch endonuclease (patch repair protein)